MNFTILANNKTTTIYIVVSSCDRNHPESKILTQITLKIHREQTTIKVDIKQDKYLKERLNADFWRSLPQQRINPCTLGIGDTLDNSFFVHLLVTSDNIYHLPIQSSFDSSC